MFCNKPWKWEWNHFDSKTTNGIIHQKYWCLTIQWENKKAFVGDLSVSVAPMMTQFTFFSHAKYTWWPNQRLVPFKQLPQRCEYVCRLNVSVIEATTRANLLNRSDVTLSRICFSTYLASMKHPRTLFTRFRLSSSLLHPPGSKNESWGETPM